MAAVTAVPVAPPPRSLPQPGIPMRVKAISDPASLGGAIAQVMRREESVDLSCIGAAAVNQAIKGVAVATGFLVAEAINLAVVPYFEMVDIDGAERTSIRLRVVRLA